MVLLRSVVVFGLLSLSTLVFSLPIVLFRPALSKDRIGWIAELWSDVNLWLLDRVCGLKYEIRGLENVPRENCIVAAKHQSAWETIAFRRLLPPNQSWVLKKELLWIPVFGWALAAAEPIAIDRKAGKVAARQIIQRGIKLLREGRFVIIFPEGTRVAPREHKRYGLGAALLAEHSGYPVLPIAHNAGVFWRRRGIRKHPGTIQVVIGTPIYTEGLKAGEINRRIEDWIESQMEALPSKLASTCIRDGNPSQRARPDEDRKPPA